MAHIPHSTATFWCSQKSNPLDLELYDSKFCFFLLPTESGAQGLAEYVKFYKKYLEPSSKHALITPVKTLHTHSGSNSVIEEALVEIALKEGKEEFLAWIIPGVRLANPGATKKACITFVTITDFDQARGKIKEQRIYWDQGSLLKQLGLIQGAGSPSVFGFHPDYLVPIIGHDHTKFHTQDSSLNSFITRLEDSLALPSGVSSPAISGSTTPNLQKTSIRLNREASFADKTSHIFEPCELPQNSFSGVKINPKKFQTHAAITGEQQNSTIADETAKSNQHTRMTSATRTSPKVENAPAVSLYDPLTGDAPIPDVYDPQHHSTNIDFGNVNDSPDDNRPSRKVNRAHLATTLDKENASKPERVGRPNPAMQTHFANNTFASPDHEEALKKSPGTLPRHLVASITSPDTPPRKVNQAHNIVSIGREDAEVQWRPRNQRDSNTTQDTLADDDASRLAARPQRVDLETTFDKPLETPVCRPQKAMESHVFDPDQPFQPNSKFSANKLKSNIVFSEPDEAKSSGDHDMPRTPTKVQTQMQSSVFDSNAEQPISPARRSYSKHKITNSNIEFGDDGGRKGLAAESPKWALSSGERPATGSRRAPGGQSTLQLG